MSAEIGTSEQKIDLSKLGQFYSPIDLIDYGSSQMGSKNKHISLISQKLENNFDETSCSPKLINKKKNIKVKFKTKNIKSNDSFSKKKNNSYNISRNDKNMNEITTTISTFDDKTILTNINSSIDEKNKITKLKELMICFLCHEKVVLPKICPNCYKIFCEECIKKWIINLKNQNCFYCNNNISLENMINIPVINNISNILNKTTTDLKNDSSLVLKQLSTRIKNNKNNNIDSSITNASCYTTRNIIQKSPHNSLDLRNCLIKIKHRKFPNSISEARKPDISQNNIMNTEHCNIHHDQFLFYYCVDCEKSYCRTCFVFFGDEKNRHNGHKIIDYDKFKDKNNFELLRQIKELKENIEKISSSINQCKYIRNCYNHEKLLVNKYIKNFIINFNDIFDENIKKLNDLINIYENHVQKINKERENIKNYLTYKNDNNNLNFSEINLLNDVKMINNLENIKDIDNLANLSPKLFFNIYHTDLKHFDIIEKNFRFKTKLKNSNYNLGILRKEKEVQVYICNHIEKEKQKKRLFLPIIYLKKKNSNWEIIELKESLEYNGHNYFIKRFNPENFSELNSYIKIKGILFESFFM
jgi:hypothetical protein